MNQGLEAIRDRFPLLGEVAWLASAGVGPMPGEALAAVAGHQRRLRGELDPAAWEEDPAEDCRGLLARLLGVETDEVALVRSTSEGLNAIACALPWEPGDNVVITDQEYPANAIPWYHQAKRWGVEVRTVRSRNGRLPLDAFAAAIDARTRAVAVSHVQFASGFRADLAGLSELAHSRGALLVVDGIQAVGALRVSPRELGLDALACGGYKWLCGPLGTGFLYVRRELAESLVPAPLGYQGISPDEHAELWDALCGGGEWVRDYRALAPGARRFDGVGLNPALFAGFKVVLKLFLELGLSWIESRVLGLSGRLIRELVAHGYRVVTPGEEGERAGIVLFRGPWDLGTEERRRRLERELLARGFKVSMRGGGIRVSCHFFNTEGELRGLLSALGGLG